jgi:phosphoglycolate phosphatase-like HAD superfamily hydrolase
MLRLITDFDGPIMDVSERYYRVYKLCLEQTRHSQQVVRQLSKSEFWHLKRARVPEIQIGVISGLEPEQAQKFAQLRRQTVHSLPYLIYDEIPPGVEETLEKSQNLGLDLVILTLRRRKELANAFERYSNLSNFFPQERCYCLADDYVKTHDVKDKPILMERALQELEPACEVWMVGDTEADIVAAKTHQIKVIAVLCGIRDHDQLKQYQPDFIVNNLTEAVEWITQRGYLGRNPLKFF